MHLNNLHYRFKRLLLILFIINSLYASGQNSSLDSLERILSLHKQKDTVRVNLLNKIAFLSYKNNLAKTKKYIKESEAISKTIDFQKGEAESIYISGVTHIIQSDFNEGLKRFEQALQIYRGISNQKDVSKCLNGIGIAYYYQSKYNQALKYYKESLQIDEEIGDVISLSSGLINIGSIYSDLGNYDKAIAYYKRALKINKEQNNEEKVANCLNNIGTIYDDLGDYPHALEYYNKAITINEKMGNNLGISKCLNNIGIIHKMQGHYDKALKCYQKSLEINKNNSNKKNVSLILNNIGIVYKNKKNYSTALKFLKDALKINEKINAKDQISTNENNIGEIYLMQKKPHLAISHYKKAMSINIAIKDQQGECNSHLGLANAYYNQQKYTKALFHALKSNNIANALGLINYQRDSYKFLSDIYYVTKKYKKAFEKHKKYKNLNDSIFNRKNVRRIAQLEYEYAYQKRLDSANKREIKLTKKVIAVDKSLEESQKQKLLAIISFLIVTILSVIVIFILRVRNIKSINQSILIEQRLLRSQMTPHFIFNTVSVLQGIILNKEFNKANVYLSSFSKLLRLILENSRDKVVVLENELKAIENYLTVRNLGSEIPYLYTLKIDKDIDKKSISIPPMMIQPFVENAIEHAFQHKTEDRQITVILKFNTNKLVCSIIDNGQGIESYSNKKFNQKKSLATTITSERLKMLAKEFKVQTNISITDRRHNQEKGTIVTLILPYKKSKNDEYLTY